MLSSFVAAVDTAATARSQAAADVLLLLSSPLPPPPPPPPPLRHGHSHGGWCGASCEQAMVNVLAPAGYDILTIDEFWCKADCEEGSGCLDANG